MDYRCYISLIQTRIFFKLCSFFSFDVFSSRQLCFTVDLLVDQNIMATFSAEGFIDILLLSILLLSGIHMELLSISTANQSHCLLFNFRWTDIELTHSASGD